MIPARENKAGGLAVLLPLLLVWSGSVLSNVASPLPEGGDGTAAEPGIDICISEGVGASPGRSCDDEGPEAGDSLDGSMPELQVAGVDYSMVFPANASLRYNHMAMVEWLPEAGQSGEDAGRLVVAWQAARSSEGSASQVLLTSYSDDAGASWTPPEQLPPAGPGVLWSPVLHLLDQDQLLLFYSESTACLRPPKERNGVITGEPRWNPGGDIKVVASSDRGETWGEPRMVYAPAEDGGIPKVIANRVLAVERGPDIAARLLLPFWRERARGATITPECPDLTGGGHETSGVLISDNAGASWVPAGRIAAPSSGTWLIEGTLATATSGSIVMLLRSATDAVWASRSFDLGTTWSTPEPLPLPNPNSKVSVARLAAWGGRLVAALNHHPRLRGVHAKTRSQLALAESRDGGASWKVLSRLEDSMSPGNWYHYPTIIQTGPNNLLVAYSTQHTVEKLDGIKLAAVTLEKGASREHMSAEERQMMGQESLVRLVPDAFSASTTHGDCRAPWADLRGSRSWCAASLDPGQWLQVDLPGLVNVTHVATAGRPDSRSDQRVTAFYVTFSRDGWRWEKYAGTMQGQQGTEELVLMGNTKRAAIHVNRLVGDDGRLGISALALRFHPVRWVGHISMQVGISSRSSVSLTDIYKEAGNGIIQGGEVGTGSVTNRHDEL